MPIPLIARPLWWSPLDIRSTTININIRSTPRVQLSTAPSLRSLEQSSQAWKSVTCSMLPIAQFAMSVQSWIILWKSVHGFSLMLLTDSNSPLNRLHPGGDPEHPKYVQDRFLCLVQAILKIWWKLVHAFSPYVVDRQTNKCENITFDIWWRQWFSTEVTKTKWNK